MESQLAQLQRQAAESAGSTKAEGRDRLAERWGELESRLEQLASGDRRLAAALDKLRSAAADGLRQSGAPSGIPPGLYWLQLGGNAEWKELAKVLQVKIQEAILAASLQDADEPVPPQYRQLIEEYYKALSDDLR